MFYVWDLFYWELCWEEKALAGLGGVKVYR